MMARAGRKRKTGKRQPNGQLVRTPKIDKGTPELQMQRMARIGAVPAASAEVWLSKGAAAAIEGTMPSKGAIKRGEPEGVPAMRMVDTNETIDPIGRAWAAGLLDGDDDYPANDLRDAGRRFAALYWRKLPNSSVVSSLYANMVSGLVEELPAGVDREQMLEDADARDQRQEAALMRLLDGLDRLDRAERGIRKATDELLLDPFADAGPTWLDWLIGARASVLPTVIGAIARNTMLSQVFGDLMRDSNRTQTMRVEPMDDAGTVGEVLRLDMTDRQITPLDWYLFLPCHQVLRWSDCNIRLRRSLQGLRLLARGGRALD
jgi:hypothetical protein